MTIDDERIQIRAELASMRESGARRQDLSQHACKRLFFDLGIRPSMAAVRDLTQTGSASDIPKDIDAFWERIRAASRIRIGTGSLPPALEGRAGELLGELFEEAKHYAAAALEETRQDLDAQLADAQQQIRDADIRRESSEAAMLRSEAQANAALARIHVLEARLASADRIESASQDTQRVTISRLEAENDALRQRLETVQQTNGELRDRIDAMHTEMRGHTEHYAQQIKDAVTEAERRVKPMLVELDSLRSMSATYQANIRDAGRKEFDFIQQLSAAKSRADRLETQARTQSDEIDALLKENVSLRNQGGLATSIAQVLQSLAEEGRLNAGELKAIGTLADGNLVLPARCPRCVEGEPELSVEDHHYELQCPDCEHTSGVADSRLEAVARFLHNPPQSMQ